MAVIAEMPTALAVLPCPVALQYRPTQQFGGQSDKLACVNIALGLCRVVTAQFALYVRAEVVGQPRVTTLTVP